MPEEEEENSIRELFAPTPILTMLIQYHKSNIASEVESMKNYITDTRVNIRNQQNEFDSMVKKQVDESPDSADEIYEWYSDQHFWYKDFYPSMFHSSTLLSLYSLFEYSLKDLCQTLFKYKVHTIKLKDLSGRNYIEMSKKYLKLVEGIDVNQFDNLWQKIVQYQKIRNCVVHNNSNIMKEPSKDITAQELYPIVNSNPHLELNTQSGAFFIKNDEYLLEFCDLIKEYCTSLLGEVVTN